MSMRLRLALEIAGAALLGAAIVLLVAAAFLVSLVAGLVAAGLAVLLIGAVLVFVANFAGGANAGTG